MRKVNKRLQLLRTQENNRWDLFCGISCAGTGVEQAFQMLGLNQGFSLGLNHNQNVIDTSKLNHPEHDFLRESIEKANPRVLFKGLRARFGWASPSCFTEDVLILTQRGLIKISEVKVGDSVWTHKNRWRSVTHVSQVKRDTRELVGYGHYGLRTTDEHPFYSKRVTKRYPTIRTADGKKRRSGRVRTLIENPFWERADKLQGGLWATPVSFEPLAMPPVENVQWDEALFHFVGCFLGDGHTSKGQIIITVGSTEEAEFEGRFGKFPLKRADGSLIQFTKTYDASVVRFCFGSAGLCRWLDEHFGTDCYNKALPSWALGIQRNWKEAMLEGYLATDGHLDRRTTSADTASNRQSVSSVSKRLALSFKLVATSLGHAVTWIKMPGGKTSVIEGRTVTNSDQWRISWPTNLKRKTRMSDTSHMFFPVKSSLPTGETELVYNMSVEEDESYLADGIVVHNCRTHSVAKGGVPIDKADRVGPEEIINWIVTTRPDSVVCENVVEFEHWTHLVPMRSKKDGKFVFEYKVRGKRKLTTDVPVEQGNNSFKRWCKILSNRGYELCMTQDKTRLGELYRAWCDQVRSLGYEVEAKKFCAADYGDATTRKRLFIQFASKASGVRCVWPKPTRCKPAVDGSIPEGMRRWRTTRDILDTSDLGKSIFERKKPLAPKTLNRILIGLVKFVITPLLKGEAFDDQFITRAQGQSTSESVNVPVSPVMTCNKHGLCIPFILPQQRGGAQVKSVDVPVSPITQTGAEALCVVKLKGTSNVESLDKPVSAILSQGTHHGLMAMNVMKYYGTGTAVSVDNPLDTITSKGRFGLQTTFVSTIDNKSNRDGTTGPDEPITTITTKQRHATVSCMIQTAYTGADRSRVRSLDKPIPAVAGHRGDGAVVSYTIPELHGGGEIVLELNGLHPKGKGRPILHIGNQSAEIDILFRMFLVKELAAAQGLPADYKFAGNKTQATAGIGNGVPVNLVRAITAAVLSQQSDIIQHMAACPPQTTWPEKPQIRRGS